MLPYVVPFSQELHWISYILLEVLHAIVYVKLGGPFMISPFKTLNSSCLAWEQMPTAKLLFSVPPVYLVYMQTDDSARVVKENKQ